MSKGIPEYLTSAEVAEMFRTTPSALYTQRTRRERPGSLGVKVGKRVLYRREDLDRWVESLRTDEAWSL